MKKRIIVANHSHSNQIVNLRRKSYHSSANFKIKNETEFENYCQWSRKEEKGIVLVALNEEDEAVSTLRANVYFDSAEHENSNLTFTGYTKDFIAYPTLDISFAATLPDYANQGFFSVLLYYMYLLHKHSVKSISGQVIKDGIVFRMIQPTGYNLKETDILRTEFEAADKWTFANLEINKIDGAMQKLKKKYRNTIEEFPLIINY